jgi:hypothetical protein
MKTKLFMRLFIAIMAMPIGNYASAYGVSIYRHLGHNEIDKIPVGSYGTLDIGEGYYNIAEFDNDVISSVKVSEGYQITLFEHADFKGRTWTYTKDVPYIGNDANDKASSFRVLETSHDTVKLYLHAYFGGQMDEFKLGDYPDISKSIPHDQVSSLSIPNGWLVVLYEHPNFEGAHKVFRGNTSYVGNDFNDRASSMRVINDSDIGYWGGFEEENGDITCVNGSEGASYVKYKERLWGLPNGTNWEAACKYKGAWIDGEWREGPTTCEKDNNVNTLNAIIGAVGLFTPFIRPKLQTRGEKPTDLASYSSIASSSLTFTKDLIPVVSSTFSTGMWGSFLIRKDSQCNTLYSRAVHSCLSANPPSGYVEFKACGEDEKSTQFLRIGETFQHKNTVDGKFCLDSNHSGNVYLHWCNGGNYQKWELLNSIQGAAIYRSRETGLCLDGNGTHVYTHQCHGGNWQQWN